MKILFQLSFKLKHYRGLEYICSNTYDSILKAVWCDVKTLIKNVDPNVRYRGAWFHTFLSSSVDDYVALLEALEDNDDLVRYPVMRWLAFSEHAVDFIAQIKETQNAFLKRFDIMNDIMDGKATFEDLMMVMKEKCNFRKKAAFAAAFRKGMDYKKLAILVDCAENIDLFNFFYNEIRCEDEDRFERELGGASA